MVSKDALTWVVDKALRDEAKRDHPRFEVVRGLNDVSDDATWVAAEVVMDALEDYFAHEDEPS